MAFVAGSFALNAQTVYLDEDFESGLPAGWTQSTLATDGGWNIGTGPGLSSQFFTITAHTTIIATNDDACNCDKSADSLFTDTIDLTSATGSLFMEFDMYYAEATYQNSTESLDFFVYSANSGTWTQILDAPAEAVFAWKDGEIIDLSAYAGDEIVIAFVYNDGGDWLYGAALDNVSIYEPAQFDASNLSVDNGPYQEVNTSASVVGTIKNMGTETITSIEVEYTIDQGTPVVGTVSGLNIAPLATGTFTHPTDWTPTVLGEVTLETEITLVNNAVDGVPANNVASTTVLVHPTPVPRKPLLEQFTSSTCPPCVPGNINVLNVMSNFPGEYTKVNYQMSWPGSGDPYFTAEGDTRRNFYGVNSVPSMHTDGSVGINSQSYTSALFQQFQAVPAFVNITATAEIQPVVVAQVVNGEIITDTSYTVNAEAELSPVIDMPAGLIAHMSIQENLTYENIETNGETEFHDVMKKMLPSAMGTALPAIAASNAHTVSQSHTFAGSYRLPNDANDPIDHSIEHSVEEWDDLHLAVWVQNQTTGEIWQSENTQIVMLEAESNIEEEVVDGKTIYIIDGQPYEVMEDGTVVPQGIESFAVNGLNLYPNPAQHSIHISGLDRNAEVRMMNALGQVVLHVQNDNGVFDVSGLSAGFYTVSVLTNGREFTQKVSIVK